MSHDPLAAVRRELAAERAARDNAESARVARDDAIRAALASGMSVAELVDATGLHRQRVYQIRDGRR